MAYTALLLPPASHFTPWQQTALAPRQPVQTLAVRRGETALVEATRGRIWLTRDGQPQDHILEAGQRLAFTGPARLRVSAEGGSAQLRWARVATLSKP
ncbi:MAG: DUF2917 domain-containing protein [Comamonadaceae bacterium]|nr:DUF2917 domain-containing protein [Comamonadaceae bacterium]